MTVTMLPSVNALGDPLTTCRTCGVPIYAVASLGADADLCADHRPLQPDPARRGPVVTQAETAQAALAWRAHLARHTLRPPVNRTAPRSTR